jgi:hypothetical protein
MQVRVLEVPHVTLVRWFFPFLPRLLRKHMPLQLPVNQWTWGPALGSYHQQPLTLPTQAPSRPCPFLFWMLGI